MMQLLGRHYVLDVNNTYHQTGTLWEGRYRAYLVAGDVHLLQCHRYIELNPLRAAMVADPRDYPWSSHRCNAFNEHDPVMQPHPIYYTLSSDPVQRCRVYRAFVEDD